MWPRIKKLPSEAFPKIVVPETIRISEAKDRYGIHLGLCHTKKLSPSNLLYLGKVIEFSPRRNLQNANVWLDINRPKVVFVVGRRGQGKSYDLGVFAEGLSLISTESPVSIKNVRVCTILIDTMNQFWTLKFRPSPLDSEEKAQIKMLESWGLEPKRLENVRIFIPRGSDRIFPFFEEFALKPSELNDSDWCGLFGYDKYAQPSGQLIATAFRKVIQKNSDYTIDDLINVIETDPEIRSKTRGYPLNVRKAVTQKLIEAKEWPIFSKEGLDIKQIYSPGQLSVIMIRELDDNAKSLVTALILRRIYELRQWTHQRRQLLQRMIDQKDEMKSKEKISKIQKELTQKGVPICWVLIDEAHLMCPSFGEVPSKEELIKFAKRGRDLGLSLVLATQQPSAVDSRLISQRDLMIVHSLGIGADIQTALSFIGAGAVPEEIKLGPQTVKGTRVFPAITRSLDRGEAFVADDEANRGFVIRIRPRLTSHGGKEATLEHEERWI